MSGFSVELAEVQHAAHNNLSLGWAGDTLTQYNSALRQCDSWRQGDSTSPRHDRRPLHGGDPGHVGPRAGRHAGHRALGARAGGHVYRHRA